MIFTQWRNVQAKSSFQYPCLPLALIEQSGFGGLLEATGGKQVIAHAAKSKRAVK